MSKFASSIRINLTVELSVFVPFNSKEYSLTIKFQLFLFSNFRVAHYERSNATTTPIVFVIKSCAKRRQIDFFLAEPSFVSFLLRFFFVRFVVGTSRKKCFLSTSIYENSTSLIFLFLSLSLIRKLNKIRFFCDSTKMSKCP